MAVPTVANGKVYVPTFSCQLEVYGLYTEKRQALSATTGCGTRFAIQKRS